jgi:hypothetical protein
MSYGPFVPGIDAAERVGRLRAMQVLALGFCRDYPALGHALAAAETDSARLDEARELIDRLPTKNRRRLLAVYGDLVNQRWAGKPRGPRVVHPDRTEGVA